MGDKTEAAEAQEAARQSPMALALVSAALSDVGLERTVNEDALYANDERKLYLLCDGMGGHASGRVASTTAIESILAALDDTSRARRGREPLVVAIKKANKAIRQRGLREPDCSGMGTTAVALRFENKHVHVCHVGDSRAYLFRGRQLQQLTRDHSLKNLYEDKPELAGRLGPATSNVIVRAVGLESSVSVEHQKLEAIEGDVYVLCSDGLSDLVEDKTVESVLREGGSLLAMAKQLIDRANELGGGDNITVILVAVATDASREFGPQGTKLGF